MEERNVLIVEDDAAIAELVADVLAAAGYRPLTIADHALIAGTVERWRPRCVLLDGEIARTGESRSWRDAAAIRRAHPDLPVVLFTADAAAIAEARAGRSYRSRAAGFVGIIDKPFVIEELLAVVKTAVDGSPDIDAYPMIVHELRQPLTIIRGQVQLARKHAGQDPDSERAALDATLIQVDRMGHMIDQLLDKSHLSVDAFSMNVSILDLAQLVAAEVASHEQDVPPRISFTRPSGAMPIYGDPMRLAQIVGNLLSNALKYSAAGSPIEVSLMTRGLEAEVRVTDHGVGVPDRERALLFTPFYRTTRTRGIRGTGLGLHISKQLAERHGGRLWLDATDDAGSTFVLALPVAHGDPMPDARRS